MRKLFAVFLLCLYVVPGSSFGAVVSRSAVKQKVVNTGTKVNSAAENTAVDTECQDSYFGCMDALCMDENVSGGRCQCSNKYNSLYTQLNEIMDMQNKAALIAENGADYVNLGKATDDVVKMSEDVLKKKDKQDKKSLSFSDWNNMFSSNEDDEEDDFVLEDDISNKKGDELYNVADSMCWEQTPKKCASSKEMVQLLYAQKIKSDCIGFENAIKLQKSEATVQLDNAQKNVRDAALAQFKDSNSYGLGKCALEFKQCMKTTGGCGNDFTGCVTLSAYENVGAAKAESQIITVGSMDINLSGSTMDSLSAKKILCENILDKCESVKDNVWNSFLQDAAFDIKSAELKAESGLRENCLSTVAECYLKACRENMDPKDPDGSYDMCLTQPENYKSFCKIELEPCLSATGGSYDKPEKSRIWKGILAELAKERADACTKEFKQCMQDDDRCGEDYSKCIGLDNEDVVDMCPEDKLTACYGDYKGKVYNVRETLARVAQGVMLSVEKGLADACQKAVDDAMLRVCGDVNNCDGLIVDNDLGTRSLGIKYCETADGEHKYVNCKQDLSAITDIELGKTSRNSDLSLTKHDKHIFTSIIYGQILWQNVEMLEDMSGIISADEYMDKVKDVMIDIDKKEADNIKTEIGVLGTSIKNAIAEIEADPRIQFCMTGRQVSGLTYDSGFEQVIGKKDNPKFPNLTQMARAKIINSALRSVQRNYYRKYNTVYEDSVNDNSSLAARYAKVNKENEQRKKEDIAREKCMALGENDDVRDIKELNNNWKINRKSGRDEKLVGYSQHSAWNYKRSVTTQFDINRVVCTKCVRTQECDTPKHKWCKEWGDEKEECKEIEY